MRIMSFGDDRAIGEEIDTGLDVAVVVACESVWYRNTDGDSCIQSGRDLLAKGDVIEANQRFFPGVVRSL